MPRSMSLVLTLENRNASTSLHLTSLAPQTGWQSPPPRHLEPGTRQTCCIETTDEITVTMHYGNCHIGLHMGNGIVDIEPGLAEIKHQAMSGNRAEITLKLA
ncbi:hypothetical protein [Thalassospira marina]|uniref:Uncharacterized protein n=1 Tax=Thalassospira marina TaxID=2048283 RepID=A0A2N3KVQ7_9PROT|nr:hypothetical protein [Thalassospira marina]PKR54671.1 hypothetical protein COO20_07940 [Thalassospira marina]